MKSSTPFLWLVGVLFLSGSVQAKELKSILETVDVETGVRTVVRTFDGRIEAPNWTRDGKWLVYNAGGHLYRIAPTGGDPESVDTGACTRCNNDHVLSFDGRSIAVSHDPDPQGSRIYTMPLFATNAVAATEVVSTPRSYLHGWSPDGKWLAYCAMRETDRKATSTSLRRRVVSRSASQRHRDLMTDPSSHRAGNSSGSTPAARASCRSGACGPMDPSRSR